LRGRGKAGSFGLDGLLTSLYKCDSDPIGPEAEKRAMLEGTSPFTGENRWPWRGLMALLFITLLTFRVLYLIFLCPLDLAQDEAHYWDWSRNLDWSYYSKGPLVAWLIRASCDLFGSLSVSLTGSEMAAVRLPAALFGSLLVVSLYVLTVQVFRSEQLAFFVALVAASLPIVTAGSILMTIDSPFVCFWGWALVAGHRAVFRGDWWSWPLVGLLVGLGILAKYTMALWLLSLGLFLLFTPACRPLLFRRGLWVAGVVALLCCLPILAWNATHGWVTFRHVAGQAGVAKKDEGILWFGPLAYVGGQFAVLLGYWFVVWACAMVRYRPTREGDPGIRYLWWMSAPTFLVFAAASLRSSGQVNWPLAGYLSGGVLMAAWLREATLSPAAGYRRLTKMGLGLACGLGLLVSVAAHESRLFRPLTAGVARLVRKDDPQAIRAVDPTCRMRGWRYLGGEVDRLRDDLAAADGRPPVVAGGSWNIPGEIGFYCKGHPTVYTLGPFFGDRHSQYDLWRPNPVDDAQAFAGRTFVVVSGYEPTLRQAFAQVEPARDVVYREGDLAVASWKVWVCRDFRGIPLDPAARPKSY
jgi:hypothetical protein